MPTFRGHGGIAWEVTPGTGPLGPPGQTFITVAYPSGIQADDLIILICAEGIFDDVVGPEWSTAAPADSLDGRPAHLLWWKIADGTESGTLTLEVASGVDTTSSQPTVSSAIIFAYEDTPNESGFMGWDVGGPNEATFPALTGQEGDSSFVVGYAFADSFSLPGGSNPSSVVDADLTVDARVAGSQDYDGPVTGPETRYMEFIAASRRVTVGVVPQYDMSATDEFDALWWRSRHAGHDRTVHVGYWGVLCTPVGS